jgi:hypothetical protein
VRGLESTTTGPAAHRTRLQPEHAAIKAKCSGVCVRSPISASLACPARLTGRRLLAKLIRKPRCGLVLNAQFEQGGQLGAEPAGRANSPNRLAAARPRPAPSAAFCRRAWRLFACELVLELE